MLKRVVLENFKSIKYLDFECAQLNLLTGLNGSGKSSFLQFMNFLRNYAQKGLKPELCCTSEELGLPGNYEDIRYCYARKDELVRFLVDFEAKANFAWEQGEAQDGSIDCVICQDYELKEATDARIVDSNLYSHVLPLVMDRERRIAQARNDGLPHISSATEEIKARYEELRALRETLITRDKSRASAFQNVWENARIVDAFRKKPAEDHCGSGKYGTNEDATKFWGAFDPEGGDVVEYIYKFRRIFKLDQENPMVFPGSELHERDYDIDEEELIQDENPGEYFMDDPLKYDSDDIVQRKYSTLLEQVNAWLSVISPGAHLDISRKMLGSEEFYCEKVGFGKNEYAKAFRPQNVGFGISYVLPVLATVLTARPTDIIIIENPEAHLHPNGQSAIGKLLARAAAYGVQLFVETHSDHVINGIRVAVKQGILKAKDVNIAFFDRRKHKVRYDEGVREEYYSDIHEIKVDKNGMLSNYPKGFLDEWDNQYYQLIR